MFNALGLVLVGFVGASAALSNKIFFNSASLRSSPITTFTSKFTGKTFVLNGTLLIDDFADTFASYRKNRKPAKASTFDSGEGKKSTLSTFISPYTGKSYPLNGTIIYDGLLKHQQSIEKLQLQGNEKMQNLLAKKSPSAFLNLQSSNLNELNLGLDKQKSSSIEVSNYYQVPVSSLTITSDSNGQGKKPSLESSTDTILHQQSGLTQAVSSTTPSPVDKTTPQTTPSLPSATKSPIISDGTENAKNSTCKAESTCIPWTICSEFEGLYTGPCGTSGYRICCKLSLNNSSAEVSHSPTQATTPITTLQPPLVLSKSNDFETIPDILENTEATTTGTDQPQDTTDTKNLLIDEYVTENPTL